MYKKLFIVVIFIFTIVGVANGSTEGTGAFAGVEGGPQCPIFINLPEDFKIKLM